MKIPKIYPLNETHWKRASFNPLLQIWWWFICDCKAREDAWYWWMIDRPRCKHKSGRRRYISAESIHYLSFPPPQTAFVRKKLQSPKKSVRSEDISTENIQCLSFPSPLKYSVFSGGKSCRNFCQERKNWTNGIVKHVKERGGETNPETLSFLPKRNFFEKIWQQNTYDQRGLCLLCVYY